MNSRDYCNRAAIWAEGRWWFGIKFAHLARGAVDYPDFRTAHDPVLRQ